MVASYHMKNSSPTMLPQRAMSLVPFQVQMPPDQALFSQVASIVDRLPVDRRLHTMQEVPAMTHMLQHSVMQQQQQIQQQPQQQTVLNMTLQVTSKFIGFSVKITNFRKISKYRFDKFFGVFVMSKKRKNNLSKACFIKIQPLF